MVTFFVLAFPLGLRSMIAVASEQSLRQRGHETMPQLARQPGGELQPA